MRRLEKIEKPEVLQQQEESWTSEYLAAEGAEKKKHERWGHPEIRSALKSETNGKCAYCESFIGDVSYAHVEHMKPKSLFPALAHTWYNLTSACQICNTNKSDFYSDDAAVLNPYEDLVDECLAFIGPLLTSHLGQPRGELTVAQLQLNRAELVKSRIGRIERIRHTLERWFEAEGVIKQSLRRGIVLDANEGEYTECVKAFIASMGFPSQDLEEDKKGSATLKGHE